MKQTNKKLKSLEKEIKETYERALIEMAEKMAVFLSEFEEKNKENLKRLEAGEIDEKTYSKWLEGQSNHKEQIQNMVDVLCEDTYNSNAIAAQMIKGHMHDVYALNMNYAAFEIDSQIGFDTSYTLYNREAVERLIRDDPVLLPKVSVKKKKDKRWNGKKFRNEITQGILQGESIQKMSKRLMTVLEMNRKAAVRNARTATTSAENGGRLNSYRRAEELGIEVEKMWLATMDIKTRSSHRLLDGQIQKLDKPFNSENGKIMYPGDPTADPAEVYNCRCRIVGRTKYSKLDVRNMNTRFVRLPDDITYDEWKHGKKVA